MSRSTRMTLALSSFAITAATLPALAGAPIAQLQPVAGEPVNGASPAELAAFEAGKQDFIFTFTPEVGLGPIFNQNSCGSCHNNPVGGSGSIFVTRFGFSGKEGFDPLDAFGGSLLQAQAIDDECLEIVPAFANITSPRITSSILGAGLVEAIDDADILFNANNPPMGVSGRAHMVPTLEDEMAPLRPGRFGWKAQLTTLLSFSGDATLMEMGITNRVVGQENAPNGDAGLLATWDLVADPEDGPDGSGQHFIDRVTVYQQLLAAPPQTPKSGMSGEAIFTAIGCTDCHTPTFTTSDNMAFSPAVRNQTIHPYSDFLLHDMGLAGDFIAQGDAFETEIKTTPLWGVNRRDPLWHDGRVSGGTFTSRMTEVIDLHRALASEATASGNAFFALSPTDQASVIAFLGSLGRAEFDFDDNDTRDFDDFVAFKNCYDMGGSVSPDDACAIGDFDQDGDVDLDDFTMFEQAFDGDLLDCNNNGQSNLREILLGAPDINGDFVPDTCCVGNANGDTVVDIDDLNVILAAFGTSVTPGTNGDLTGEGMVDIDDLNLVLSNFGGSCS